MLLSEVIAARERIRPYVLTTPLEPAYSLAPHVYFKLENVNILHSFKIRGALNAILSQTDRARTHGVVTASAGNHGQGLVYAAAQLGIPATVVMPTNAPQRKIDGVRRYGAEVILHGAIYDDAELYARDLEQRDGKLFVSPYNDPHVVLGQATIALELLEKLPQVGRVVIPVGGGGLIAGMGFALKTLNPTIEVLGVQSVATPAMYNYLYGENLPQGDTLADGLAGDIEAGSITFDLCRQYADSVAVVEESAIAEAIRWVFYQHGWVIEGSAAVSVAAWQTQAIPHDAIPTVLLITGGNIDAAKFRHLLED